MLGVRSGTRMKVAWRPGRRRPESRGRVTNGPGGEEEEEEEELGRGE
jgi:hypothetical protein